MMRRRVTSWELRLLARLENARTEAGSTRTDETVDAENALDEEEAAA